MPDVRPQNGALRGNPPKTGCDMETVVFVPFSVAPAASESGDGVKKVEIRIRSLFAPKKNRLFPMRSL